MTEDQVVADKMTIYEMTVDEIIAYGMTFTK